MREILFRGKNVDTGEWVYGAFIPDLLEVYQGDTQLDGFIKPFGRAKEERRMVEVECETVGQYTGMGDKNGRKIFEHDLLKDEFGFIHEVYFDGGCFMRKCGLRSGSLATTHCALVVVGNVFDNSDLLKGE